MDETLVSGSPETPKKSNNNTIIIIVVAAVVLCCCCLGLGIALYYGYDSLGDPLGIYGALPRLGLAI